MTTGILIRDGCVLTLGARTPNYPRADLLIEGDRIAEVGPGIRARDAEQVDASDTIVMPGFVDTHRHAVRSLLRNLGGDLSNADGRDSASPAPPDRPDDVYAATLIGLLGAAEAGITTVVDFSDARIDGGAAEAALQAHADAGLRTVFVHADEPGEAGPAAREVLARLAGAAGPFTTIAFGSEAAAADAGRLADAWARARTLGLPIQLHAGIGSSEPGRVAGLAESGLLGRDVTVVHGSHLDEADLDAIASSGSSVSLTPVSQMAGGLGAPPIQPLVDRQIRPGLGVDDERMAPGDLFAQMRATISLQHATLFDRKLAGKAGLPRLMSTRDVIRYATVEGARVAGLDGSAGSLEPGMQADIIVLRTDRPNISPVNDPIGAVVWGMDTSNVDWVIAGGRVLMREGVLQADVPRARGLAAAARERLGATAAAVAGAARGDRR